MSDYYCINLEKHDEAIEIESTIKNRFKFMVPLLYMEVTTQDLIAIKNKIEEILRDEQIS